MKPKITTEKRRAGTQREHEETAITPLQPTLTLKALVQEITPGNVHGEQDWGEPVGKEA